MRSRRRTIRSRFNAVPAGPTCRGCRPYARHRTNRGRKIRPAVLPCAAMAALSRRANLRLRQGRLGPCGAARAGRRRYRPGWRRQSEGPSPVLVIGPMITHRLLASRAPAALLYVDLALPFAQTALASICPHRIARAPEEMARILRDTRGEAVRLQHIVEQGRTSIDARLERAIEEATRSGGSGNITQAVRNNGLSPKPRAILPASSSGRRSRQFFFGASSNLQPERSRAETISLQPRHQQGFPTRLTLAGQ